MNKFLLPFGLFTLIILILYLFKDPQLSLSTVEADKAPIINKLDSININLEGIKKGVDAYFDQGITNSDFAGSAVAIVYKDSVIYMNTFGNRSATDSRSIDEHTLFRIGSLSKGFNGILAGIMNEKGYFDWDDNIHSCLSDFKLSNNNYLENITLSHLLSHSAGFPYHSYTNLIESGASLENILKEFIQIKNLSPPGYEYSYQNAAFATSGLFMEKASFKSYDKLLDEYIFEPSKMKQSSTDKNSILNSPNKALPVYNKNGVWHNKKINAKYYNAIAAGGINSSISDMSLWLKLLLGNYPDIINKSKLGEVFQPQIETKVRYKYYTKWPNFVNSYYARGWRVHTFANSDSTGIETLIHHGGQVSGYRSEIMVHPREEYGICVLFNNYSKTAKTCIPAIMSIVERNWQKKSLQ